MQLRLVPANEWMYTNNSREEGLHWQVSSYIAKLDILPWDTVMRQTAYEMLGIYR